jgi:FtsP/CotA-like multicopper oxidase with cupredoxin domain
MRTQVKLPKRPKLWTMAAMLAILVLLMGATSYAATQNYYLKAGTVEIPHATYAPVSAALPNGLPNENILMWGYALCTDSGFLTCGAVTVPGPVLYANQGDTLTITVKNALTPPTAPTAYPSMIREPTSLVINGQTPSAWTPAWVRVNSDGVPQSVTSSTGSRPAGDVSSRVRSFNKETAVGSIGVYSWGALNPGTYLYESGTHPAVQVQMGLYGALVVYPTAAIATAFATAVTTSTVPGTVTRTLAAAPQAYNDPSTAFASEVVLLYSEVDQELHYSIASGPLFYGHAPPAPPAVALRGQRTSTFDYAPNFFLINGTPWTAAKPAIANAGKAGQKTLIRFLNAGLLEKTPTLLNLYMTLIAEDGNPFIYNSPPSGAAHYYSRQQYSFLLPAGKTTDAILTPAAAGSIPVFDRSLNLTNGPLSPSGMGGDLTYLTVK